MTYPLKSVLEVMKPCKPNKDNPGHMTKLDEALDGTDYIAETKWDGCRYLYIDGRFFSTHIQVVDGEPTGWPVEKTAQLRPIVQELYAGSLEDMKLHLFLGKLILDGEIVVLGGKAQDVVSVVGCEADEAVRRQEKTQLHYMVFDILRTIEGASMIGVPWEGRRAYLDSITRTIESELVHVVKVVKTDKRAFLDAELAAGREGIVLKSRRGLYYPGKRPAWCWLKVKAEFDDDVVIMGFEPPTREYTGKDANNWLYWEGGDAVTKLWYNQWIGAVVFGKYNRTGRLVRLGTCSGMTEDVRASFSSKTAEALVGKVMRITAMEITRDGAYRHPRFLSLHEDKLARECLVEDV